MTLMPAHPHLGLLIFRHPEDVDVVPFEDAIVRAFQGGKDAAGYVATGEDLGAGLRANACCSQRLPSV